MLPAQLLALRCRLLLLCLLPSLVAPFWPTYRGEANAGCASQRSGPAASLLATPTTVQLSQPLPNASSPFAPSPLVGPTGTVYVTTGAPATLQALAGDTLALLVELPLPAAALASPYGLQLQPDGSLWANGLGLLQGDKLTVKQGSTQAAALVIAGAQPAGATTLAALEPCGTGSQCLVVRSLALPSAGGALSVTCTSAPLNFRSVVAAVRADENAAFFVLEDSGVDRGTALVSLDLATCNTTIGDRACVGGWRTTVAPFFSTLLVDVCTAADSSLQVAVLSAANVAAPQLYALSPAAPGYSGACTAAPPFSPASPASAAVFTSPADSHTLLLLSCALQPQPPAPSTAPPTPFLFAYDLPANGSAAAQLWATPLPAGYDAAPLRGLAIDKAGTVYASAAPHGSDGSSGGMLAFAAASGALLGATPCDSGCAVFGQPAIGLDGTLYAYQGGGGGGAWGALATFQAPLPPELSQADRSNLQHVLAAVGGALGAVALAGLCWSARARCVSAQGGRRGAEQGGGGDYSALREAEAGGGAAPAQAATVAEMRAQLSARGVSHAHCVEKGELRELLRQSSSAGGGAPRFTRRFKD